MEINAKRIRAMELNLRQLERFESYKHSRLDTPIDVLINEFYAQGYEVYILRRISILVSIAAEQEAIASSYATRDL